MMDLFKKIFLTLERILFSGKKKKDVLLVVFNELMFSYARPIYEKLSQDPRVRVWFCFYAPRRFKGGNLKQIKDRYRLRTIPYKIAKYFNWDLIFFPLHGPYFRKDCPKVYVGHGIHSGKVVKGEIYKYGKDSRDKNGNIIYERIFTTTEHEKENVKELYPEYYSRMKVVGSLLLDEFLSFPLPREEFLGELKLDHRRKTIFVASTWGPHCFAQNLGLGFVNVLPRLLEEYNVIFSIHQNNFVHSDSPDMDWHQIMKGIDYPNLFVLRNNEEPREYLQAADLLVTDHTSLSFYFLFMDRPIVFYKNPDARFEENALVPKVAQRSYIIHDLEDIDRHIAEAFDKFQKGAFDELKPSVCSHIGHAWRRYEEEIYDLLKIPAFSKIKET